jgi:hypothetical protein
VKPFPDIGEMIRKQVDDWMRQSAADHEEFVKAWVSKTGVPPDEAEMVETVEHTATGFTRTVTIRKRTTVVK